MKKGLKITLIISLTIVVLFLVFLLIRIFGFKPYDKFMFNRAIKTGDVKYCHKILDSGMAPGLGVVCVSLVAQKNNDSLICGELQTINSLYISDCYAMYAYYKNDESLCVEPQCSKTLFNTCKSKSCGTIRDYL